MRWSFLLLVLVIPAIAMARPKVAVAPLDGDSGGKIAEVVADAAADSAKVTRADRVQVDMDKLSITTFDGKAVKRLRNKLEVDVVIHGKVQKKRLELTIAGKGKNKSKLEIDFKTTKDLKKALAAKLGKRIDDAAAQADDDDDDEDRRREEDARRDDDRKKREDDDRRRADDDRKKRDDDRRKKDDDKRRRTSKRDDDGDKRKRTSRRDDEDARRDEDDDDDRSRRRRRKGDDDGETRPRHPVTQAAVWLDAGAAFARRTFTYEASGAMRPPPVGTAAPAGLIEGELYPAAFSSLKSPAAGFGLAATYNRAFALGIAVPGTTVTAPIVSGSYSFGARYRLTFGGASVAAGLAYWGRYYMADRSGLMMANQLDMPDVNYKGVAPQLSARFPLAPKIGGYVMLDIPLMFDAGSIGKSDSYGSAKISAFDLRAGAQIMLGPHYALQIDGHYDQVNLKFDATPNTMAATRGVSAASDKDYGLAVTVGVLY